MHAKCSMLDRAKQGISSRGNKIDELQTDLREAPMKVCKPEGIQATQA
jgi:hypothetical protein